MDVRRNLKGISAASCLAGLFLFFLATPCALAAKPVKTGKGQQIQKERLVLMPLRLGEEDQKLQGAMETALVEGLQKQYEVLSGEQVARKAREIFQKESRNTTKKECDETRCLQGITEAFNSELLAIASVTKQDGGYFLALSIRNLYDNIDVYSKSLPCRGCDSFQAVDKIKELVGTPSTAGVDAAPEVALAQDAESALWNEVQKGNVIDDYQAYLAQYPKGKFAILAKTRIKKFRDQAATERSQQEQTAWENANGAATESSYQGYLDNYPNGQYAPLAQARMAKLKRDATQTQPRQEAEALTAQKSPAPTQSYVASASDSKTIATVNGVAIPQPRMEVRIKAALEQGQKDEPELRKALRDDLINLEAISQAALKKGLDRHSNIPLQLELGKQSVLAKALYQDYTKTRVPNKSKQEQQQAFQEVMKSLRENAKIDLNMMTVNGVSIPQARIDYRIEAASRQGQSDTSELRKAIKDDLISLEVLSQEATKKGLDRQPEVAQQIELAKQSILAGAFVKDYVQNHPVTEGALQQAYENLKNRLGNQEYKVAHILVASENEARTIATELKRGRSFDKVAKEKSKDPGSSDKGGDLGWATPSNFVKPFGDAIQTLAKGELSDPVQTQFGWHIIKLEDTRELKVPAYAEVKPNLEQRLQQPAVQAAIQALRANARIE